ncbi:MAG TPA: hypothetical protein VIV06_00235 [Candidatus Limnocylindrales bacterium]
MPFLDIPLVSVVTTGGFGLLVTALVLGIRHGIDWDHIAAITDITSTTVTADAGELAHRENHRASEARHEHAHGGLSELRAHDSGPGAATFVLVAPPAAAMRGSGRVQVVDEQRDAIVLGTLYALGHASVVAVLGLVALAFGAVLPDWVDPIMGRVVGATLVLLGTWVFVSLYQYARHGTEFRLRSRWMLVFDSIRFAWRRLQSRLHGHEHVEPVEMSSYGPRTAFGVGMIHGIGAETGTQVLLIAAVGGAAGQGLGIPMMVAFIVGLIISNSIVVVVSATGFVASRLRQRVYLTIGAIAGTFSLAVGLIFLLQVEDRLPDLDRLLGFLGR